MNVTFLHFQSITLSLTILSYSLVKMVKKVVSSANIGCCSLLVTMPGVRL